MTDYFKNNKTANRCLKIIHTVLPLYVFANYPILLFYTFFWRKSAFLETLVVPAAVFTLITVLRISINTYAGIFYIIIALLISLSRIFAGVHYISDVIVGAVISILCGVIFLFVI